MKIYNPFKKEYYTSSFDPSFLENKYEKLKYENKIETIFIKENKCVFVINDEEIGKKIYEIIENLKNYKEAIYTKDAKFKVTKTVVNYEHDRIFAFYVEFNSKSIYIKKSYYKKEKNFNLYVLDLFDSIFEYDWVFNRISKIEKIIELVSFIGSLQKLRILFF